ncbi:MAG TPA: hypothetical protein VIF15_10175, partial [Polyangiaceae bacterium]
MHWPYSLDFSESFYAAQMCGGLMLTALLLFWRFGPAPARWTLLAALWVAALATTFAPFEASLGVKPGPDQLRHVLALSAALGTVAAVLAARPAVALVALLGEWPLWLVSGFVKESEAELGVLHLAWLGLLLGLLARPWAQRPRVTEPAQAPAEGSYRVHDAVVFLVATALAAVVCLVVMHRRDGSGDEWGYTYQAAVFAKGHIYAQSPRCQPYLQSFYVFESSGRLFSQYTPGWPLFIAPFVLLHVIWLSGPVSMGLMALAMARLGRTAMRGFGRHDAPPAASTVRVAGTWAAGLTTLGTMILINGASRYAHVFTLALYALSLEALFMVATPGLSAARQRWWGLVLGSAAVLGVATRPADGAFVGIGMAALFVYVLVRRRVGWRAFVMATVGFAFWTGLCLVILRLQLGKWFTTGYSLNAVIHPWNVVKYSMPQPREWKYGLPLATGAYCWWPCSMGVGLAGLAMLRGRALGLVWAMALGCVPYIVYCMWLDLGQRGYDWGYGPRYLMVLCVPMAVGGAVALAPLTVAARERLTAGRSAFARGGPLALALFAVVCGWVRIVPLVWPTVASHVQKHSGLNAAIEALHLKNAIVVAQEGTTGFDPH